MTEGSDFGVLRFACEGSGTMLGASLTAPASTTQSALSNGFMVGCWGLAALSFGEWLNGHAGPGILLAVGVELALGLGFFQTRRVSVELETAG
ncbi:hypothetical protein [Pseudomonas frederiksbergensis]|uniref:hypothetical protein n=1 Tax=Pseudomonas frederiksbergensis TaxID=104087 RepID=UPI003D260D46